MTEELPTQLNLADWFLDARVREGRGNRTALITDALLELGGRAVWEEAGRLVTHLSEPDDPDVFTRDALARLRAATALPDLALAGVDATTQARLREIATETVQAIAPRTHCPSDPY